MVTTKDYTVAELIEMWREADLTVSEGEVTATEYDKITVEYEGSDGILEVEYSVSDQGAYRSDTEERFEICWG